MSADKPSFPSGFVWGVATSAYQIEGSVTADGRGESNWDRFSHMPGNVENGDTGDTACDHYARYAEDIALLSELKVPAYRFSVAWPRIQPTGSGPRNPKGLDFYSRLVDGLLERGIAPVVTLYHFDLPQALEDRGGWTDRDTAVRFVDYAASMFESLADRVSMWITNNELMAQAYGGYILGIYPPGRRDDMVGYIRTSHHLLLSHGLAVEAYRGTSLTAPIGTTLGVTPTYPASGSEADRLAAHRSDGIENRWYLDAILKGRYPADTLQFLGQTGADLSCIQSQDAAVIGQPVDFIGVNYYSHAVIAEDRESPFGCLRVATGVRTTETGSEIVPDGLYDVLMRLSEDYPGVPLYITENGAAFPDELDSTGRIDDQRRVRYLRDHILACAAAVADGVDLRGYFAWSLIDNFEWQLGYRPRFGLVYVDYGTQERLPKASAAFFSALVAANGLDSW